jgi:hypothetical protein
VLSRRWRVSVLVQYSAVAMFMFAMHDACARGDRYRDGPASMISCQHRLQDLGHPIDPKAKGREARLNHEGGKCGASGTRFAR